jgi:hypothetical protein
VFRFDRPNLDRLLGAYDGIDGDECRARKRGEYLLLGPPRYFTAPTASTRSAPSGLKLKDGHGPTKAYFAFSSLAAAFDLWDVEVGVPGYDNGEALDLTNQWLVTFRQFAPRYLHTLTEFKVTGFYDPVLFTELLAVKGVEGTGTIHFPDGSTLAFYCYIRMFEPTSLQEGTTPKCTITVKPTNADPTTGAEEAPVLVSVAGT